MKLKLNSESNVKFKLNNSNDLVEFEGEMVPRKLAEMASKFLNENRDSIVEKPTIPTADSKGRPINSHGNRSYVKLLREGEQVPTVMLSKDNSASEAYFYSSNEARWKKKPSMWQEYVYDGSLGIDYVYIDDKAIKEIIKKYR